MGEDGLGVRVGDFRAVQYASVCLSVKYWWGLATCIVHKSPFQSSYKRLKYLKPHST